MSPRGPDWLGKDRRFPRVSGDEPETVTVTAPPVEFSPRERG